MPKHFFISLIVNCRYHSVQVEGSLIDDFEWLINLVLYTPTEQIPRMLIFFNNSAKLCDAFQYVFVNTHHYYGQTDSSLVMFQSTTLPYRKEHVINTLSNIESCTKIVFCSSSLSMGINIPGVQYVIHYGPPNDADWFLQETGRTARDIDTHGHSILMIHPRLKSGRKLDSTMKKYCKGDKCLRSILLEKFNATKPCDQEQCCDVCDPAISCELKIKILESFQSSATDTVSESDSVGSLGGVEELENML